MSDEGRMGGGVNYMVVGRLGGGLIVWRMGGRANGGAMKWEVEGRMDGGVIIANSDMICMGDLIRGY